MKKVILALLVVVALVGSAYSAEAKSLVIVFSRAGENYSVGNVTIGNTMKLAQIVAEKTGAELFEVKPAKEYPAKYDDCTDIAKREQNANARPAILADKDISGYDTIYFGYPVWWGDIPMCMYTFIEAHDWTGKTVIPFCTHEGSGAGRTDRTLPAAMRGATVKRVTAVRGATAQNNRAAAERAIDGMLGR
ncbi:MAG: flavodoxin [Synergistaceae bacterium]|nr:flavodoxin [Synergistaceae bacterium]